MTDSSTVRADQLVLECFITKCCKDCGEIKSAPEFHRDKCRADGLAVYCRPCIKIRAASCYAKKPDRAKAAAIQWRKDNPERKRANGAKWRAENKDAMRESSARWYEQNKDRSAELGRRNYLANKERQLACARRWSAENREAVREIKRRWKKAHPEVERLIAANRRARMRGLTTVAFTVEQLSAKWDYYGRKCWVCGSPAEATDHVKPVAKGGAHMLCNLRPICKRCNSSKAANWPYVKVAG